MKWLMLVGIVVFASGAALADTRFSPDHGLIFDFPAADAELRLGGRLHLDEAKFRQDTVPLDDDYDVRRGRPSLTARLGDFNAKAEIEFAEPHNRWRNVWLGYNGIRHTTIRVGNLIMPFGMEETSSSNEFLFAERSLATVLAPSYGTGLLARTRGKFSAGWGSPRWTLAGGAYTEPFSDEKYDRHRSSHNGFATRVTLAPLARKRRVIHLGASYDSEDIRSAKRGDRWIAESRTESNLAPVALRANLRYVHHVRSNGFEGGGMWGPILLQGEWIQSRVDAAIQPDVVFGGWYAQAGWLITGEHHRYERSLGNFGGVKPRHRLGAVELGVRYSTLDLTDGEQIGGSARDVTLGLNWYLRYNMSLLFNYIRVNSRQKNTLVRDDPTIFELRFIYALD